MSRKKFSPLKKGGRSVVRRRLYNPIQTSIVTQKRILKEMYVSLFEHNPDCIISFDLQGNILHINPSAEKALGYSKSDLEKKPITAFVATHMSDQVLQYIQTATADNQLEYLLSIYHKDGYQLDVVTKFVPIYVQNEVTGVYAIMKHLAKSERIEKTLQENEHRLRTLLNSLPAFVLFKDHEGRWLEANDYAVTILNFENVPYRGKTDSELIPYNESYRNIFLSCQKTDKIAWQKRESICGEEMIIHSNSTPLILDIIKVPLFHPDGSQKGMIIMGRDVTDLKKTEELLRKSEKLAVVGQLTAGIAHEIRNPLTSLKGFLKLLEPDINETNKWYVDVMLSEITQMESITNQFMAMSKPQTLSIQSCQIQTLIKEVVTFILPTAVMHSVHIIMDLAPVLPTIPCDGNQLKQVFINILKNAIEAMPHGGNIFIQTELLENESISIRVIDEGCGIPEDRISHLGEPFYSLKEKGTGLGLMMCYKIIEEHNGKLLITSKINKGTTVDIRLPILSLQES